MTKVQAGARFGMLVAVSPEARKDKNGWRRWFWRCRCDCGAEVTVAAGNLHTGNSKSCGCATASMISAKRLRHGHTGNRRGRKQASSEYNSFVGMIGRCENPNNHKFPDYGGRGITVCDRWRHSFEAFLSDMGMKPSAAHSLGRIDNDGPYAPENCRWETPKQQRNNRRDCKPKDEAHAVA